MTESSLEKIISLAKRRGFVYPASEIYGGLSGFWDLGPYGAELAHNIKELWWNMFVKSRADVFGVATTTIMPDAVWKASGHLEGFADPMVECEECKKRFRADQIEGKKCPECEGNLGSPRQFNLMFKTEGGYLRPEIAQGMFVNFKNVLDTMRAVLPFGLAQIGKAYRNEIAPRDFLFRVREFDLMEFEYFVKESEWEKHFESWRKEMWLWIASVGIDKNAVSELEVPEGERAHYSKRTIDFEFEYPFGKKELYGLAYRADYDLSRHMKESGVDLRYTDPVSGEKFTPHVIEPTFGLGRTILAILTSAYTEDKLGGEPRTYLKLKPSIAPVKVAVFPLVKNKPALVESAREIYKNLKKEFGAVEFDDNGNIGKRYRRQDEIGTPWCVTVDYQTFEDDTVTVRDRDTGEQIRRKIQELGGRIKDMLS
ncbi:MAG: glycine--tRNA ligase [Candidatus Niyogibacteria bacterium RIFCSPLOWO2_01_FULL_45_48]|uniref:glycine--tRNA ligase n=2 Tax=Candidatus Niyogiibacteriota TaxID=1817912 RepID=A0A1G2EWJ2_9BACT|nr:MAG: glycine--tRNA ligase [Candidatus Niyogibacteria bacterium RIFCSPHIGHO2_01_FULL_45_28]OGZ30175.1 MAG: glycine--tRNA ligase [Candidatus Niyogibacteria bacterium RIFCSPLOWO2_02_FULL_45_13]OGZ30921.1 MAG: glycine--tRNA ligase [Candidatus Niyogibacteria bacterium RIFCSPLOWO2_01_FULL_45_48]